MTLNYSNEDKSLLLKKMYLDIFFFAEFILGDKSQPNHYHVRVKPPQFHKEIADELLQMGYGEKLGVVAPRSHGKTTFINLIFPLHRILFGEEHFILMISESEAQSKKNLQTLADELLFNNKLIEFFGERAGKRYKKTWGKEEIEVCSGFDNNGQPTGFLDVLIRGTGQKARGLKYGAYRPSLTIVDDGEGESNTTTPEQRAKFRAWVNGAVIPGSDDGRYIELCTIVDEDSHLNRICGNKAYKSGKYKIKGWRHLFYQAIIQDVKPGNWTASGNEILENGKPKVLWPERKSYEWLNMEYERLKSEGDEAYFYQEYQNIPMDDSFRIFKKNDIIYWNGDYLFKDGHSYLTINDELIPVNIFIGMDPASSEKTTADYTVIMVVAVSGDNHVDKYRVITYFRGQVAPLDGAKELIRLCEYYHPTMVNIEKTGHVMLTDYMTRYSRDSNKYWNIIPRDAIGNKFYRLKALQPEFAQHRVEIKAEHSEFEHELLRFKQFTKEKKDTIDAFKWAIEDAYPPGLKMINGKWEIPQNNIEYDIFTGQIKINDITIL